jgi:hypothetical protein
MITRQAPLKLYSFHCIQFVIQIENPLNLRSSVKFIIEEEKK